MTRCFRGVVLVTTIFGACVLLSSTAKGCPVTDQKVTYIITIAGAPVKNVVVDFNFKPALPSASDPNAPTYTVASDPNAQYNLNGNLAATKPLHSDELHQSYGYSVYLLTPERVKIERDPVGTTFDRSADIVVWRLTVSGITGHELVAPRVLSVSGGSSSGATVKIDPSSG